MENLTTQNPSMQRYLTGNVKRNGRKKLVVDMEAVYADFRDGMTLAEVTSKYKISATTLYRRHEEYQEKLKNMKTESEEEYVLPPLPKIFN